MTLKLEAKPGGCEECAILPPGIDFYAPCNEPATTLLDADGRTYRMCDRCAARNVRRGMVIIGAFTAEIVR